MIKLKILSWEIINHEGDCKRMTQRMGCDNRCERSQKGKILDDVMLLVLKMDSGAISQGMPVASKNAVEIPGAQPCQLNLDFSPPEL